jgi:hypothetical protein
MYEYCAFMETGNGYQFNGVVLTVVEEKPVRIGYQVLFDRQGLTQSVNVDAVGGAGEQHLQLVVDEHRAWFWNGKELLECSGFSDVDLGFSPVTNALPIRRLNLQPGERQTISAAWVRFPEFDVIAFPQRYTRLRTNRYLFESLLSDFKAELVVDEMGIVKRYDQYWVAVAAGQDC